MNKIMDKYVSLKGLSTQSKSLAVPTNSILSLLAALFVLTLEHYIPKALCRKQENQKEVIGADAEEECLPDMTWPRTRSVHNIP